MEVRKHITFYGRVQGVGFRCAAKRAAQSLRLTGWVKNEPDGTVIMEIQGRELLINEALKAIHRNSFIKAEWIETKIVPTEKEDGFRIR